jgi:hypothetical protein
VFQPAQLQPAKPRIAQARQTERRAASALPQEPLLPVSARAELLWRRAAAALFGTARA